MATKNRMDRSICVVIAKDCHVGTKCVVANHHFSFGILSAIKSCRDLSFDECCETHIQPEVLPILHGYLITRPLRCDEVNDVLACGLCASENGLTEEGKKGILHSTIRVVARHNQDVEIAPNVGRADISFNSVKQHFKIRKLRYCVLNKWRFGQHSNTISNGLVLDITNCNRNQVAGNREIIAEACLVIDIIDCSHCCLVCTHVNVEDVLNGNACTISVLDRWSVLQGYD